MDSNKDTGTKQMTNAEIVAELTNSECRERLVALLDEMDARKEEERQEPLDRYEFKKELETIIDKINTLCLKNRRNYVSIGMNMPGGTYVSITFDHKD